MGFSPSEKPTKGGMGWAATIALRAPLKPINTGGGGVDDVESESGATTPTSEGSRIPVRLPCPPPPRKRRAAARAARAKNSRCNDLYSSNGKKEFFVAPPDLEAVFIRRHVGC